VVGILDMLRTDLRVHRAYGKPGNRASDGLSATLTLGLLHVCPSSWKNWKNWKNSRNPCCQGSFQRIADLSVSSRRKLHRAQPLVQQLVFFEKRVTQSFTFR
jgi:hypothetical protein